MNTQKNDAAVRVKELEKKFGKFTAVNRISFEVKRGEIFGFLGPNGAGKSTTIRMLCGIISPTSGSGYVGGYDINRQQELIKQNIGYMSQKFSLYDGLTVEENIDFYSGIYKVPKARAASRKQWIFETIGIGEFRSRLTAALSGGWKQRLALACAIIHEPKIIFLDEPTSGVDPIARQSFWNLLKKMAQQGVTAFITTHYMDEAENCSRLALIYKGAVIAMGTSAALKSECMKEKVLKISVPDSQEWIEKIQRIKGIKEAALFGINIHAVVKDSLSAKRSIEEVFRRDAVKNYQIDSIPPSLEDVFVSMIESYDLQGGTCETDKG